MTIHRRLKERNLGSYRPLCHLSLTPAQYRDIFQWCLARTGWNHAYWGRIVLSDDFSIQLCPDDHRRCVWRRPRQRDDHSFLLLATQVHNQKL
ncbi:HTH_Tnp_Tc3_2 domain-containing protein [Trichonephila clavipes]|nr:HTH_Tnp_Tc3_2 domain-containing protein [Trichonephila clavipes]